MSLHRSLALATDNSGRPRQIVLIRCSIQLLVDRQNELFFCSDVQPLMYEDMRGKGSW